MSSNCSHHVGCGIGIFVLTDLIGSQKHDMWPLVLVVLSIPIKKGNQKQSHSYRTVTSIYIYRFPLIGTSFRVGLTAERCLDWSHALAGASCIWWLTMRGTHRHSRSSSTQCWQPECHVRLVRLCPACFSAWHLSLSAQSCFLPFSFTDHDFNKYPSPQTLSSQLLF